jgi:hypothetical protein
MYKIPEELRDLPEADRLRRAQAAFTAAAKEGRNLTFENEKRVRLVGERLRNAQNELGKAQKAFDLATGEPKPVGLTPAVVEEIGKHFPAAQHDFVKQILDQECGRTIPFLPGGNGARIGIYSAVRAAAEQRQSFRAPQMRRTREH